MGKKWFNILYLLIILLFLMLSFSIDVYGFGISPASRKLYITGIGENTGSNYFMIINTEHKDLEGTIEVSGEIADKIIIDNKNFKLAKEQDKLRIDYTYNIPIDLILREYLTNIYVIEQNDANAEINTKIKIPHQFIVTIGEPAAKLIGDFNIIEKDDGILIDLILENKGNKDTTISPKVEIIKDTSIITTVYFDTEQIKQGEKKSFRKEWLNGKGFYNAHLQVIYDGKKIEADKMFYSGKQFITPVELSIDNFKSGEINKINLNVKNNINADIKEVKAELLIQTNNPIKIQSIPLIVNEGTTKKTELFLDTKDLVLGEYIVTLSMYYLNKNEVYNVNMLVEKEDISFQIEGINNPLLIKNIQKEISKQYQKDPSVFLLIAVIIMCMILIITALINIMKPKRNN